MALDRPDADEGALRCPYLSYKSFDKGQTQCYLTAGHVGLCDFLPPGPYHTPSGTSSILFRFSLDEPKRALWELEQILKEGNLKHGHNDWKTHSPQEFLIKAQRHYLKAILGQFLDDSGHPHFVHAAANLLLATELDKNLK